MTNLLYDCKALRNEAKNIPDPSLRVIYLRGQKIDCRKDLRAKEEFWRKCTKGDLTIKFNAGVLNDDIKMLLERQPAIKKRFVSAFIDIIKEEATIAHDQYIDVADELQDEAEQELALRTLEMVRQNTTGQVDTIQIISRIRFFGDQQLLLDMHQVLKDNEMLPGYTEAEILTHYIDEKGQPFENDLPEPKPMIWNDDDTSFALFVRELDINGLIKARKKFELMNGHYLNMDVKPFKNLKTKNYKVSASGVNSCIITPMMKEPLIAYRLRIKDEKKSR